MKQITIAGNLGKDATLRRTQSGDAVLGFSVAVEERQGQEKRSVWFDCSIWGKRGETLERFLTKGTRVAVAGELSTREHEGKTYLTVKADQVTLMGGGERRDDDPSGPRNSAGGYGGAGAGGAPAGGRNDIQDEIPFAMEWRA
jgi:single-strand DNA-binding protein